MLLSRKLTFSLIALAILINGCAHQPQGKTVTETRVSQPLAFQATSEIEKNIYIQASYTNGQPNLTLEQNLKNNFQQKGFRLVQAADKAHFLIHATVFPINEDKIESDLAAFKAGYGTLINTNVSQQEQKDYMYLLRGGRHQYSLLADIQVSKHTKESIKETSPNQKTLNDIQAYFSATSHWKRFPTRVYNAVETRYSADSAQVELENNLVTAISDFFKVVPSSASVVKSPTPTEESDAPL